MTLLSLALLRPADDAQLLDSTTQQHILHGIIQRWHQLRKAADHQARRLYFGLIPTSSGVNMSGIDLLHFSFCHTSGEELRPGKEVKSAAQARATSGEADAKSKSAFNASRSGQERPRR